jgi:hypothetical protein
VDERDCLASCLEAKELNNERKIPYRVSTVTGVQERENITIKRGNCRKEKRPERVRANVRVRMVSCIAMKN